MTGLEAHSLVEKGTVPQDHGQDSRAPIQPEWKDSLTEDAVFMRLPAPTADTQLRSHLPLTMTGRANRDTPEWGLES